LFQQNNELLNYFDRYTKSPTSRQTIAKRKRENLRKALTFDLNDPISIEVDETRVEEDENIDDNNYSTNNVNESIAEQTEEGIPMESLVEDLRRQLHDSVHRININLTLFRFYHNHQILLENTQSMLIQHWSTIGPMFFQVYQLFFRIKKIHIEKLEHTKLLTNGKTPCISTGF